VLEDEHEQPVRGADREQVEAHRRRGDDERAEDDGQEDERQREHQGDHPGRRADHRVEVVDVLGGGAADQHMRVRVRERGWDDRRAQVAHRSDGVVARWVAAYRNRQQRNSAAGRAFDLAAAEALVFREPRAEPSQRLAGGGLTCALGHDDLDRVGRRPRKVAPEGGEALFGLEPVRQRRHAAGADPHPEDGQRGGEQQRDRER
jgi:hypothetical protein